MIVPKTRDGRVMFIIPWHDHVLLGTTDTPISSIDTEPTPLPSEMAFLLETAAEYLSHAPTIEDCLSVFTGIRPACGRETRNDHEGTIERSHPRGFFFPVVDDDRRKVDNLSTDVGRLCRSSLAGDRHSQSTFHHQATSDPRTLPRGSARKRRCFVERWIWGRSNGYRDFDPAGTRTPGPNTSRFTDSKS